MYQLGFKLYTIYEGHPDVFVEFSKQQKKNKGCDIEKICKWCMNKRESISQGDINILSDPAIYKYIQDLPRNNN